MYPRSVTTQVVTLPENDNWFWYRAAEGDRIVFCGPAAQYGAESICVTVPIVELPDRFLRQIKSFEARKEEWEVEQRNIGCSAAADYFRKLAISGERAGTFSGKAEQECKEAILALHDEIARLKQENANLRSKNWELQQPAWAAEESMRNGLEGGRPGC